VGVRFDEVWVHRVGQTFYPDGLRFNYFAAGIRWWPQQPAHDKALTLDYWFHQYSPREGDIIFDIGAGRGEDVRTFAEAVGPRGRVVAVEAHPVTFDNLRHVCRLNRLGHVTCVNAAVMGREGTTRISSVDDWQSNVIGDAASSRGVSVRSTTVDHLRATMGIETVDFLKVNIEGAEVGALDGMTETLAHARHICIACHDFRADRGEGDHFRTRAPVTERLRARGYEIHRREDDQRDYVRDHIHARRSKPA
jgi:FkbM family methyltransferase